MENRLAQRNSVIVIEFTITRATKALALLIPEVPEAPALPLRCRIVVSGVVYRVQYRALDILGEPRWSNVELGTVAKVGDLNLAEREIVGTDDNPTVLAVSAWLDPSENFPDEGRIIVGSPRESPKMPGHIPNVGGFCMGVDGAIRLIATLQCAVEDVKAATHRGGHYIGPNIREAARAVLEKYETSDLPDDELIKQPDYLLARGVDMHIAVANMNGLESANFEDSYDDVRPHPDVATDVYRFSLVLPARTSLKGDPLPPTELGLRVIVRHTRHVVIQYRDGDQWKGPSFFALGITADALLALMLQRMSPMGLLEVTLDKSQRVRTLEMSPITWRHGLAK